MIAHGQKEDAPSPVENVKSTPAKLYPHPGHSHLHSLHSHLPLKVQVPLLPSHAVIWLPTVISFSISVEETRISERGLAVKLVDHAHQVIVGTKSQTAGNSSEIATGMTLWEIDFVNSASCRVDNADLTKIVVG